MRTKKMEMRKQMVEEKKERNTGFSLVELIVVIAIMAILAIVIAPQVMKYIGKSRTSVDAANMNLYKTAATTALADETVYEEMATQSANVVINIVKNASGVGEISTANTIPNFKTEFLEILNNSLPLPKEPGKAQFKVTIEIDAANDKVGKITVESVAATPSTP
ncbi:type II secretion system protein [Anaerosporobacter faecicola]|uniref:type II secretion system protein n=1 Tax=Anaerosporobacter faecicola TaxID=2718714 RepID=UPI001EE54ADD|nr:type II secretion system protein [Anaerosporobacter faecicola]